MTHNQVKTPASTGSSITPINHLIFPYSQATIGNRIYIFGGRQGIDMGESSLNDLYYFDIETKTWTQIPENDTFPAQRSFHQMVSVGQKLFVFGGCGKSGRLSDLHEFDTATSKWIKHSNVIS